MDRGVSRRELAAEIGVGESKIQSVESGHQRADHEFIGKILRRFELDANWLMNDDLGMGDIAVHSSEFVPIAQYDIRVSAGSGAAVVDEERIGEYAFKRDWIRARGFRADQLRVVLVTGDSMMPALQDGDLVLIDHGQAEFIDGRTFVVRFDDQLFVKKVQKLPQQTLLLISANPEYPPIALDLSGDLANISVIGRVVASMQEWR